MLRALAGALDALAGALDALAGALDALDGVLDALAGALDALDGALDALDGALDALDGVLDALDGASDALDGASDALDGAFDALDGTLGALDGVLRARGALRLPGAAIARERIAHRGYAELLTCAAVRVLSSSSGDTKWKRQPCQQASRAAVRRSLRRSCACAPTSNSWRCSGPDPTTRSG